MFDYIIGNITDIKNNSIVVENNKVGYLVYVSNPYSFELDSESKVYIYQQVSEDSNLLYGFKTLDEKELFLKRISVKGLGCKMALPILAVGSVDGIIDAIEREVNRGLLVDEIIHAVSNHELFLSKIAAGPEVLSIKESFSLAAKQADK